MSVTVFDRPGRKVRLDDISADPPKGNDPGEGRETLRHAATGALRAPGRDVRVQVNSVLVVLQGRDGAGKDGSIKHVVGCLNPRGVIVTSFGVPTPEERQHDFLWRVHRHAPRLGEFSIFNRSHYEDVLVVRVHDLAPKSTWKEHFGHIRDFEELLAEHGNRRPQVLPAHHEEGAGAAPARARGIARHGVEAEPQRLEGTRLLGR